MDSTNCKAVKTNDLGEAIKNIISLEEIERTVVQLRVYEGLSLEEVASVTGLSVRSVSKLLENAKLRMR